MIKTRAYEAGFSEREQNMAIWVRFGRQAMENGGQQDLPAQQKKINNVRMHILVTQIKRTIGDSNNHGRDRNVIESLSVAVVPTYPNAQHIFGLQMYESS